MKKYSAFLVGPLAAALFIVGALKGPYLLQHIDSMSGVAQSFTDFSTYLLTLLPAILIAILLGFPVFYLVRWIASWKLLPCLLGAAVVVVSVGLLLEHLAVMDVQELITDRQLPAFLVGTAAYGVVFWFLITKYSENAEN